MDRVYECDEMEEAMEAELRSQIESLAERLKAVEKEFSQLERHHIEVFEHRDELKERLMEAHERIAQLESDLAAMAQERDQLKLREGGVTC